MFDLTGINVCDNLFIHLKQYLFSAQNKNKDLSNNHLWNIVTKYDIQMNNAHLRKSNKHNLGVFASTDLKQGDIITIYPADYLVETVNKQNNDYNLLVSKEFYQLKFDNLEFNKENLVKMYSDTLYDYFIHLEPNIQISSIPDLATSNTYLGHMINDATDIIPTSLDMEHQYYNSSQTNANCCFKNYNNVLFVIAINDISKDDEILATYGINYWLSDRKTSIE